MDHDQQGADRDEPADDADRDQLVVLLLLGQRLLDEAAAVEEQAGGDERGDVGEHPGHRLDLRRHQRRDQVEAEVAAALGGVGGAEHPDRERRDARHLDRLQRALVEEQAEAGAVEVGDDQDDERGEQQRALRRADGVVDGPDPASQRRLVDRHVAEVAGVDGRRGQRLDHRGDAGIVRGTRIGGRVAGLAHAPSYVHPEPSSTEPASFGHQDQPLAAAETSRRRRKTVSHDPRASTVRSFTSRGSWRGTRRGTS